jgi:hypothetical protein
LVVDTAHKILMKPEILVDQAVAVNMDKMVHLVHNRHNLATLVHTDMVTKVVPDIPIRTLAAAEVVLAVLVLQEHQVEKSVTADLENIFQQWHRGGLTLQIQRLEQEDTLQAVEVAVPITQQTAEDTAVSAAEVQVVHLAEIIAVHQVWLIPVVVAELVQQIAEAAEPEEVADLVL